MGSDSRTEGKRPSLVFTPDHRYEHSFMTHCVTIKQYNANELPNGLVMYFNSTGVGVQTLSHILGRVSDTVWLLILGDPPLLCSLSQHLDLANSGRKCRLYLKVHSSLGWKHLLIKGGITGASLRSANVRSISCRSNVVGCPLLWGL